MSNQKLLIKDLESLRNRLVDLWNAHMISSAYINDIDALNDAIDILKRIVIVRGAKQFPLEERIPFEDMDEIARMSIARSFASFIETDKLYGMKSEIRNMPGTRLDSVYYEGDLMVVKPK